LAGHFIVASGSPSQAGLLFAQLRGSGQLTEITSRAVQPVFDGSHCRFFCCLASLDGFLAITPRAGSLAFLGACP
jgi:hypothetical protein